MLEPPAWRSRCQGLIVLVRILFKQDGSLAARPTVTGRGSGVYAQAASESALRAIERCAPYNFCHGEIRCVEGRWKLHSIRGMFRG